jgi:CubicO group peptidase (beta-lactamase class C family)
MTARFSLDFSDSSGNYHLQLKQVDQSTKNSITIDKQQYKIKGSDEAVARLKSHLKVSEFENAPQFTASLKEGLGIEKKESVVFQKIISTTPPEEKRLKQWLKAFNSGNPEKIKEFYQTMLNPPNEAALLEDLKLYENVQGFNLIKIISSTPGKIEAIVQEAYGFHEYAKITLTVEPQEPSKVLGLSTVQIAYEEEPAPRLSSEAAAITAIRSKMRELAEENKFSGTVLIVKPGQADPLIAESIGFAKLGKKNSLETEFNLASMSKMFTAVGVLQLIEQGKVSLDDPIGKHLPEISNDKMKAVTVRQLLTHTGGTGRIEGEFRKISHPKGFMDGKRQPLFEPGTQWDYSNYGFLLLGLIIENVSGKDYYQYIQEKIFDAAGMKQSSYPFKTALSPNTAVGYMEKKRGFLDNQDLLPLRGTPAGGGYSTGPDLIRFSQALLDGKLLKPSSLELIRNARPVTSEKQPSKYAIGFMTGDHWFGHSGRYEGANGELRILQSGHIVAILANRDPQAASALADFITDTLPLK